jgi:hypothetical protein
MLAPPVKVKPGGSDPALMDQVASVKGFTVKLAE